MAKAEATAAVTAENNFTDGILLWPSQTNQGMAHASISGTFVATVTVQISDDDSTYRDIDDETFTGAKEKRINITKKAYYRIGVKTGDFTSGTVNLKLTQQQ